ncbi:hypothetical protein [Rhodohalobacter sp. SW132]|uniref:hypothetical protein n=1 Tax=Rhodohalobacter sp. SW132 TaxID=2293433 RepID=UPI0011C06736|nr:hypothetical protein [Rhodohalobacter sp. SW132]
MLLLITGCSTHSLVSQEPVPEESPDYTLFFYIHGDSDYLFHQSGGEAIHADEHALDKALNAAKKAETGEVYIFHHRAEKNFLGLIPRRKSQFYHFQNGQEIQRIKYRRSSDDLFMEAENRLHALYGSDPDPADKPAYFLYFGHEIPLEVHRGYNASHSNTVVDTKAFATGLSAFIGEDHSYDLVALSSCSNGTPAMAKYLQETARYLLASPQNLHLSHINFTSLELLNESPDIDPGHLAEKIAAESYDRLTESVQTVVSLAVYDLEVTGGYIEELYSKTREYLNHETPNLFKENRDCIELPFFDKDQYSDGVRLFYRPPRFGSRSSSETHSGWGCKIVD